MQLNDIYANTAATGFVRNFFSNASANPTQAWLAAPFFTTAEPVTELSGKGCDVTLIVRFSPATDPVALRKAWETPRVKVHFYTDQKFHTKLYIIDDVALVGSANLTTSGLEANRELSVLLRQDRDPAFHEVQSVYDELWNYSDALTDEILKDYARAYNQKGRPQTEDAFERFLKDFVKPVATPSIVVDSTKVSKERSFIQQFRRKYDETLVPAHDEILATAQEAGFGRPEFEGEDPEIEMGRFLGWLRLVPGAGDGWRTAPLVSGEERGRRIAKFVADWQSTKDTVAGDMYVADKEIINIANIRKYLCDPEELEKLTFDDVFDYLLGCHAFLDRLRFVPIAVGPELTGVDRLRIEFMRDNRLENVKKTIGFLLSGPGDAVERAYDCIHNPGYKLAGFGEAGVMELLGWGDPDRPPINNRTIRGIRFLGYDVERWVAGE